ncbi:MAG TPA: hypothetical protein VJZ00_22645 [Thermoanaerobaculia bacterium]|nr:hypothetical protein [Thermoanaerobaculia bacterium]
MKSAARTCLLWAVLYLVIAALVGRVVYERYPELQPAVVGGLAAGFFLWIGLAYVAGVRTKSVEIAQLRKALDGARLEDGEHVAVAGVVTGGMETLQSPITHKRCLAYEYKAIPPQNTQLAAWQGLALAPCSIQGRRGIVRILAAPDLAFDEETVGSREHQKNLREYIGNTTFLDHRDVNFKRDLAHLAAVNADDDGRIRDDVRGLSDAELDTMMLSEKVLCAGDRVVAFGLYSSARGGLVPDPSAMTRPVKIVKGEPEELLRKASRGRPMDVVKGCGCAIPVVIAALIGILAMPLVAIEELFPTKDPSWLEVRIEQKMRKFRLDTGTITVIGLDAGEARGKMTWHGTTAHWNHASAASDGRDVNVTITGEAATLVARFRRDGSIVAARIGDVALPIEQVTVEQMMVTDDEIRGRLTYLTPKNEPSLRVAFHATYGP